MPRRVLTRAESRQLTRERLLEAAARVLARRGYHRASVQEVASEAGYTVGALYSNFDGKEGLLLGLVERESARIAERIVAAAGQAEDAEEKLRRGAGDWMAFLENEPKLYAVFMEFWAIAVRDRSLARRNAELWGSVREALGSLIAERIRDLGSEPVLPPGQLGAAVVALADGIAIQRLEDPSAIPSELLGSLLAALVPGLARDRSRQRSQQA